MIGFICDMCSRQCISETSDEECMKEMMSIMPEAEHDELATVCDDCFRIFMNWFEKLTPDEKCQMREEYIKNNYQ